MSSPLPRLGGLLGLACALLAAAAHALAGQGPLAPSATLAALPPGDHFDLVLLPSGDTLRYTITVPPGLEDGRKVPLVLALHPGSMAAPWIGGAYLHQLVKPALEGTGAILVAPDALVVPEAPYRTESFSSSRNQEAVLWLREKLLKVYPIDRGKVVLTGYSRGGQSVWEMADRHRALFSAAIAVSARPTYAGAESVGIPLFMIHSIDDEVIGAALVQGAYQELATAGADVRVQIVRGPSHYQTGDFVDVLKATIPWLEEVWGRKVGTR